jgi:hypothetical protein
MTYDDDAIKLTYYAKNKAKVLEQQRSYYENNKDHVLKRSKDYYDNRKAEYAKKRKAQRATPEAKEKARLYRIAYRYGPRRNEILENETRVRQKAMADPERRLRKNMLAVLRRKAHPDREHRKKEHNKYTSSTRLAKLIQLAGRPRPDVCDICGENGIKGRWSAIVFDHCHETGIFRGWLCQRCNRVLGFVHDDTDLLHKLITYLQR